MNKFKKWKKWLMCNSAYDDLPYFWKSSNKEGVRGERIRLQNPVHLSQNTSSAHVSVEMEGTDLYGWPIKETIQWPID